MRHGFLPCVVPGVVDTEGDTLVDVTWVVPSEPAVVVNVDPVVAIVVASVG